MKPLFTIHAGEFLVDCEIERKFRHVNVWIPAKDTGIDLLVSNNDNTQTVSLQVKFSRDYLSTTKDAVLRTKIRAVGWWTPTPRQIETSRAQYWVFVLFGLANSSKPDFIIIKRTDLIERLQSIHGQVTTKFHIYFWVTKAGQCWETRGLNRGDQLSIAENQFAHDPRNFTPYLNNWSPIRELNG